MPPGAGCNTSPLGRSTSASEWPKKKKSQNFSRLLRSGGSSPRLEIGGAGSQLASSGARSRAAGAGSHSATPSPNGSSSSTAELDPREDPDTGSAALREKLSSRDRRDPSSWLDPLARSPLLQAPLIPHPAQVQALGACGALPELEQLIGQLVRRAAWSGDRRRGAARLELGSGELAGATLFIESDRHELKIDLQLPPGASSELWRERIASRLEGRGFSIRELHVH